MMIRRWWHSLGFHWQVYLFMVLTFGGIIAFVEGIADPFVSTLLDEKAQIYGEVGEVILWIISIFVPTLAIGFATTHLVMRKMNAMVRMAKRLSQGDLTARIQSPKNRNDAFNDLSVVFNDMAQSLQELVNHEKRLLADISHELRSPLTRMSLATALLPLKNGPDEIEKTAAILDGEIAHMTSLVGMLLEHARGRLVNHEDFSAVNLSDLTADAADAYDLQASAKDIRITRQILPGIGVRSHPLRLRMIIDGILANAEFYAPPDTEIEVRVGRRAKEAFVSIRDHGPGVPDEHLQDIFKAFFRVDESRARSSGGVGLGLALAHDAAVAMGGDIVAVNRDPGLEVIVTLPQISSGDAAGDSSP
jgi:two-component system sensor histidine kinase CpxA